MKVNHKQLLPIGTIVQLNDQKRKIMICGRQQVELDTDKSYDYIGCEYPSGLDGENVFLFDADQILMVYFLGYQDLDEVNQRFLLVNRISNENKEENKETSNKGEE